MPSANEGHIAFDAPSDHFESSDNHDSWFEVPHPHLLPDELGGTEGSSSVTHRTRRASAIEDCELKALLAEHNQKQRSRRRASAGSNLGRAALPSSDPAVESRKAKRRKSVEMEERELRQLLEKHNRKARSARRGDASKGNGADRGSKTTSSKRGTDQSDDAAAAGRAPCTKNSGRDQPSAIRGTSADRNGRAAAARGVLPSREAGGSAAATKRRSLTSDGVNRKAASNGLSTGKSGSGSARTKSTKVTKPKHGSRTRASSQRQPLSEQQVPPTRRRQTKKRPRTVANKSVSTSHLSNTRPKEEAEDDDAELRAMLAQHNSRFSVTTYEPRMHGVRDVRAWERKTGKRYYDGTAKERETYNAEIELMKRQQQSEGAGQA